MTMPIDSPGSGARADNIYVVRRFAIKLVIISVFALAQSFAPWGFVRALVVLFGFAALIDVGLALLLKQRFKFRALSYWDEAGMFFLLALLLSHLLQIEHGAR